MAGQGKDQVWRFGRRKKRGRAGDWFVIVVLAVWCTVSACCPFNSGHRKSNTIRISACHVQYISSYVSWVILYRKRKGKAAVVMSCLKKWRQEGKKKCHRRPLGGTGGTTNSFYLSLQTRDVVLCSTTGLDYITTHSLTHLLPCAPIPADG